MCVCVLLLLAVADQRGRKAQRLHLMRVVNTIANQITLVLYTVQNFGAVSDGKFVTI